ncbi:ferritin family protein [Verrucomicrobiota bacterium]
MAKTREEVVQAAIQLERDGRDFYLAAAQKTSSELARKMFEGLAADEERHIEWIGNLSSNGATASSANRATYDALRPIFADAPAETKMAAELSEDDLSAIDVAIGMEEKSIAAYQEWASEDSDEDVQNLCQALVGQEQFHKQMLVNTRTYLDKTADWFMQEEQWNFEGG